MKKRNLALSALILSQALTQVSSSAFAGRYNFDVKLSSDLQIDGKNYRLELELDIPGVDDESPEFFGSVELRAEGEKYPWFPVSDADGAMKFQRVTDDRNNIKYVGLFCSSTFEACEEPENGGKFELTRDGNSWKATILTSFEKVDSSYNQIMVNKTVALKTEPK